MNGNSQADHAVSDTILLYEEGPLVKGTTLSS